MRLKTSPFALSVVAFGMFASLHDIVAAELSIKIQKKYLNLPILHLQDLARITIRIVDPPDLTLVLRLVPEKADYWVFQDVSDLKGKIVTINYEGDEAGLNKLYQDYKKAGQVSLYRERNLPQFHFTTRRGWINDPNGLIYHNGEYHLLYQHNPCEREWQNMHWRRAVSINLIHCQELRIVISQNQLGIIFSGSVDIDYENTAGFNQRGTPTMVIAYTTDNPDKQVQCIAHSLDNGRTFTKYPGNTITDFKHRWNSKDTRNPEVFWYAPNSLWVLVRNERDECSIYTSCDLTTRNYESHLKGFCACPERMEFPVGGKPDHTKWVMYGLFSTYMIGSFDEKVFTPESGKHRYPTGALLPRKHSITCLIAAAFKSHGYA